MGLSDSRLLLLFPLLDHYIFLQKHHPESGYLLLNLSFSIPLLLHELSQLQTFQLDLPLAFVVQDVLVGFLDQGRLQLPQFFFRLVVGTILLMAHG